MRTRIRCHIFGCLILFFLLDSAHAAIPFLTKLDLFHENEAGYATYRIPGIVVTTKGTILAYCEGRKDSTGDWAEIDIQLRRSTDGGKTFGFARKIAHLGARVPRSSIAVGKRLGTPGDQTVNNPLAIVDRQTGAIHFLYCVEYARCFYMRSDDDGVSFSKPVDITSAFEKDLSLYDWKIIATGPGHGIQLADGRLIVPIWLSTAQKVHHPSIVSVIYSDDHGEGWRRGDVAAVATGNDILDPNEAETVQLSDGRVMFNVRSESKANRRIVTTSPDGARHWSKPVFDDALPEPICFGSILRVSDQASGRSRIIFANPDNLARTDGRTTPGLSRDRKNLSVKLSYDEAKTWPITKTIEPGPSGYCDLAVLPDGTMLCFYERASETNQNIFKTSRLSLAHFNLEWLTDGKDSIKPR